MPRFDLEIAQQCPHLRVLNVVLFLHPGKGKKWPLSIKPRSALAVTKDVLSNVELTPRSSQPIGVGGTLRDIAEPTGARTSVRREGTDFQLTSCFLYGRVARQLSRT